MGTGFGDSMDISKLRYHHIIIMADADVDGAHIRTLLLTFFFRYMRQVIEDGYLYIALAPLYRISVGRNHTWIYSDDERDKFLSNVKDGQKANLQRYKGLGEMNPDQLWETTMDREKRTMLQVSIGDAMKAEEIFSTLMGDEVAPRKKWIQGHATQVKNLDV
jgi:DNA gyrase subunit B